MGSPLGERVAARPGPAVDPAVAVSDSLPTGRGGTCEVRELADLSQRRVKAHAAPTTVQRTYVARILGFVWLAGLGVDERAGIRRGSTAPVSGRLDFGWAHLH